MKAKVDAGADFIITQLYFDNADFFRFVTRCRDIGITVPIIAGIMPVTNVAQIKKFTAMCGAAIPEKMRKELNPIADNPEAVLRYGVEWSARQCRELLAAKVDGLHFYTLNKSMVTMQVVRYLRQTGALR